VQVSNWNIEDLTPYENNPRINDQAVEAVAKSIQEFGFRQPIVVDTGGVIVCGHTRWKAAKELGLKTIPVHVAVDLSPVQVKAYRLADNKIAELADWDCDLLSGELAGLEGMDFDLSTLGFPDVELEALRRTPLPGAPEILDMMDEVPETPNSKVGEFYMLGKHRLLVGDSTNLDDVCKLMGDLRADLLLTAPPCNVDYEGKTPDALKIRNDCMPDAEFRAFLKGVLTNADAMMHPGAAFYIWYADVESYNFHGACQDVGWQVRQCLIWVKSDMVIGWNDYHWQHEPCLYGWKAGTGHQWFSDRSQTTVFQFNRPNRNAQHPTPKPVELFEYQMLNSTSKGQVVLDLFGGSGTTLIAAERTQRVARLMELDPRYADVIRRRWAELVHGEGCEWESLTPQCS